MALTVRPQTLSDLEQELSSGSPMAYIPVAESFRVRGLLAEALEICQRGIASGLGSVAGHILLARIHFDMGKYDLAEAACQAALAMAPQSISARKLLIHMALKRRLYIRALTLLDDLCGEVGDDPDLVAAELEAQRGLAERFARELLAGTHVHGPGSASTKMTREELLGQIRARPEVLDCRVVGPKEFKSDWAQMLHLWETLCRTRGVSTVRLSFMETRTHSILIRDLGPREGTLVVALMAGSAFGPVKRVADLLAAKAAEDSAGEGTQA
jgi:tetratricopeptide (TPR) repeat protein